jgi:outer membrane autotransporter protein
LIGSTKFADDKVVGSITADSRHNGTTGSVSVSAGLDKSAGAMKLQPFAGLRYTNISFKGYADSVKQEFGGWSYGAFTGFTGLSVSRDLQAGGFTVKRELSIGLSYDAIRNFNDNIIVRLPNASVYYIPTDVPEAVAGNGLIGLNVSNGAFGAGLGYRIDLRENFTAHTFFGKLRVTF